MGRRFDPVNEKIYHIEDAPPLTTNAPLCERMTPMEEEHNAEQTLVDRFLAFDLTAKGMRTWFENFGVEEE